MPSIRVSFPRPARGGSTRLRRSVHSSWSSGAASGRPFRHLWAASTVADLGGHVSALALPLTAITILDASPLAMGVLTATSWVPYIVLGLIAGIVVDRVSRRTLMLASDYVRAGLLLLVPILYLVDQLGMAWLITIAFGVGSCGLLFQVAQAAILPGVVPRSDLADANGRLEASHATAQASGPALAGTLIGVIPAPLAVVVNAMTFVVSAVILRGLPRDMTSSETATRPSPKSAASFQHRLSTAASDVLEGLGFYRRVRVLGSTLLASLGLEVFGFVFLAVYLLFMSRDLGLSGLAIGVILSLGGVGAVLGAIVSDHVRRRLGFGMTMVWSMAFCGLAGLMIPMAIVVPPVAIPLLAAAELLQYGSLAIFNIGARTLRQSLTPDHLLGRVSATARMAEGIAIVGGSLLGGVLGGLIGLGETLIVGSIGMLLAIPPLLRSGLRSMSSIPGDPSGESDRDVNSSGGADRRGPCDAARDASTRTTEELP
ncbi:MAG TPA: MFS transporter [Thermomicrobiales bacterium]|jgi:MFS family permease|nr:MFS transporter [Thermomicrobiales bacterium]